MKFKFVELYVKLCFVAKMRVSTVFLLVLSCFMDRKFVENSFVPCQSVTVENQ